MNFPEHLLHLRTERGFLQKEVAKAIGVSILTYQRYEYGHREPHLSQLVALADFYGISLDELAGREWPKRTSEN